MWMSSFDLARRNKAAGLKTTAACNRCDAVLWSRAWRSEPCVDRLACLAGANDVRSPVAVSDNDPTRRPKTGTIDNADQDSLAVKTFSGDQAGAVPFDDGSFSGGKVRSVSALTQPVNIIRGSCDAESGDCYHGTFCPSTKPGALSTTACRG